MDLNSLIGLQEAEARQFLKKNGYNNIETMINSKHNELVDTRVVCAVKQSGEKIILVCGEFCLNIGEK